MDFETLLKSDDSVLELKCKVCKNLLSYFPIHSSDDDVNICGRCTHVGDQHRNKAYETVAQFIHFPCRFEGCNERLLPKNMPKHEQVCLYKTIKCPVVKTTGCDWTGPFFTVLQHCQNEHFDLFLDKNEFEVGLTFSFQTETLLQHKTSLLIFSIGFDISNSMFQYSIHHIEDEINLENFVCQVILKNNTTVIVEQSNTKIFNERTIVQMPLDVLLRHNKTVAFGKIKLGQSVESVVVEKVVTDEMLSQLKCSVCSSFALPPVYHRGNKIYCSKCTGGDCLRIYSLDNIAALLNYPCENRDYGCTVVLKPSEMKKHQSFCLYGSYHCLVHKFVVCEWYGFGKDMLAHIEAEHQGLIQENNSEISHQYTADCFIRCYIIRFGNRLFLLLFYIDKARNKRQIVFSAGNGANERLKLIRDYRWSVLTLTTEQDDQFVYQIEVVDVGNRGRKLLASRPCQSLPKFDRNLRQIFANEADYCCFTSDQIHTVNNGDDAITFRVSISKH